MANFEIEARNYMSSPLRTAHLDDSLDDVHDRMQELGVSALPVADDDGHVVGLLSRTDLLRTGRRQSGTRPGARLLAFPERTAGEEMTEDPVTLPADAPLSRVAKVMSDDRLHRVFVTEDGEATGVVTPRDLMRAVAEKQVNHPLSRYMSSPLFTVRATESVSLATERLEKAGVTGLVVVDDGLPVGVFTQTEALAARHEPRDTPVQDVMSVRILLLHAELPIHRAAAQAGSLDVRRIVALRDDEAVGIVTGLDFARVVA